MVAYEGGSAATLVSSTDNDKHPSFTSFKDRLRALSPGRHSPERSSFAMSNSRGRDPTPLISTGRGGAGNLVRSISCGQEDAIAGAERGREIREASKERPTHAGRGGAGNVRSPSRDPTRDRLEDAQEEALQEKLIAERRGRQAEAPFSSGRGGVGNISDSRSRSRSAVRGGGDSPNQRDSSRTRTPNPLGRFSSGRGGYGNITEEMGEEDLIKLAQEQRYEAEMKRKYEEGEASAGVQRSIGRGGAGSVNNHLTPVDISAVAQEEADAARKVHGESPVVSRGGRGGAGNIRTREEASPVSDRGRASGGVIGSMFRSLSRAARGETAK